LEPPREWAVKSSGHEMNEEADLHYPGAETPDASHPALEFPTEPFPCPACAQMLAASCRVCVACRHVIDPAEIARRQDAALATAAPAPVKEAKPAAIRFPWLLFFAVLGVSFLLAQIFIELWGVQKGQLAMGGVQTLAGTWVFFDALWQGIPRPLRWGVGSMLLPVVIFPWYLARRRAPQSPCPFVEAEMRPLTRFLLLALIVFFLVSLVFYIVQGPAPR
jgi:hypothetical protein